MEQQENQQTSERVVPVVRRRQPHTARHFDFTFPGKKLYRDGRHDLGPLYGEIRVYRSDGGSVCIQFWTGRNQRTHFTLSKNQWNIIAKMMNAVAVA